MDEGVSKIADGTKRRHASSLPQMTMAPRHGESRRRREPMPERDGAAEFGRSTGARSLPVKGKLCPRRTRAVESNVLPASLPTLRSVGRWQRIRSPAAATAKTTATRAHWSSDSPPR
jgi:hypothetical protein